MNKGLATSVATLLLLIGSGKMWAASCQPADLLFCGFPLSGFKVGRINDIDFGDGVANVDEVSNQLQIDAARFQYDETQIHTSTSCNAAESELVGSDVEIAFTLDPADSNLRTISGIWILPCNAVEFR